MGGVALRDHGASRGDGRGGVAPGHRKGQGEIARPKDRHRTQGLEHAPQIGARKGLPVGEGPVDPGIHPRAFANERREEPKLAAGPRPLALQPGGRQRGLAPAAIQERISQGFDLGGDGVKESRARFRRRRPGLGEGRPGGLARRVNLRLGGLVKHGLDRGSGRRVQRLKAQPVSRGRRSRYDAVAVEGHATGATVLRSVPMGAIVIEISSPPFSVKRSGGTIPVPVIR